MTNPASVGPAATADRRGALLSVLARLLLVGLTAGTVTGTLAGAVLLFDPSGGLAYEPAGAVVGAVIGLVLGLPTALAVAGGLLLLRRTRPRTSPEHLRAVATGLAGVVAGAAARGTTTALELRPLASLGVVAVTVSAALLVAAATVPWCLRPWTPPADQRSSRRRS